MKMGASGGVLALFLFGLVLLSAPSSSDAVNPGFKVTLTQNGLNYAAQQAREFVQKNFNTVQIPNQAGIADAPVIGKVEWILANIIMAGLTLPASTIQIQPGSGVLLVIEEAALAIGMDFFYRELHWPHIKGKGILFIAAIDIDIAVWMDVGEANGRPTINVVRTLCHIGNLHIKEHGGPSWLINFFLGALHNIIKAEAEKAIGAAIQNILNSAGNRALQTIPFTESFGGIAEVDYSLVSGPTFGPNYLTINSKGEFYYLADKTESPFAAGPMPDEIDSQMMQILLSDFVPDSASYVFRQAGKMTVTLSDKDLPSWSPIRLNTNSWAGILPQLAQKYPGLEMTAVISASSPPTATFSPQGILVNGPGQIVVSVLPRTGGSVPVFAININVATSAKVTISGQRIYPQLSYINSPFSEAWSNVGSINLALLDRIITILTTDGIVPFFNYFLSHGINIPTIEGVTLVNPTIRYGSGYLAIASDFSYPV